MKIVGENRLTSKNPVSSADEIDRRPVKILIVW